MEDTPQLLLYVTLDAHVTCGHVPQPPLQSLQSGDVVGERSVGVVALQVGAGQSPVVSRQVEPAHNRNNRSLLLSDRDKGDISPGDV